MGKLDIAERRLPQDGAIPFKIDGKVIDLRLSMLPTASNERIVMRVLNKDAGDISLEQLNFEEQDLKNLRKASWYPRLGFSYRSHWIGKDNYFV
jgi:type IV pilus assembly protein PilB